MDESFIRSDGALKFAMVLYRLGRQPGWQAQFTVKKGSYPKNAGSTRSVVISIVVFTSHICSSKSQENNGVKKRHGCGNAASLEFSVQAGSARLTSLLSGDWNAAGRRI
jgi:hypothetical protein